MVAPSPTVPRYYFDEFVLSPRRRLLLRGGSEQPLIPRYFDLLVFLVERRHEAVHRRDIFERVWSDVTVSDSALSQAIRSIRLAQRTVGDDDVAPDVIEDVAPMHGLVAALDEKDQEVEVSRDERDFPPAAQKNAPAGREGELIKEIAGQSPSSVLT